MRLFALILLASTAQAESWAVLHQPELRAALTGREVIYDSGARQDFRDTGRTLYSSGRPSWGYWQLRGDQYCSMWPPSDLWACYDVAIKDDGIRFIGEGGDITEGRYAK